MKLSFFIYYLFHIEVKIFVGEKWRNFGLVSKIFPEKVIVSPKSVVTSKMRTVINFYAKALKHFPEKRFRVYRGFSFHWSNFENDWNKNVNSKIILKGENSFLQMYCNKIKMFWKNFIYSNRSVAKSYFCNDTFRTISNRYLL